MLTVVPHQLHGYESARILLLQMDQLLPGSVRAAVVDQYDFIGSLERVEDRTQALDKLRQGGRGMVDGNYDRQGDVERWPVILKGAARCLPPAGRPTNECVAE